MLDLDTDQMLRVTLGSTPTTPLSFSSMANKLQDGTQLLAQPVILDGTISTTSPTTLVAAYDSGLQTIDSLEICNLDNIAHDLTLDKFTASTPDYVRTPLTLAAGHSVLISARGIETKNSSGSSPNTLQDSLIAFPEYKMTPTGTTQTWSLDNGNHQYLDLSSTTGDVTLTVTRPTNHCAGTLLIKQHSTARNITFTPGSGSIKWNVTQPTWSAMTASYYLLLSWVHVPSISALLVSPGEQFA